MINCDVCGLDVDVAAEWSVVRCPLYDIVRSHHVTSLKSLIHGQSSTIEPSR